MTTLRLALLLLLAACSEPGAPCAAPDTTTAKYATYDRYGRRDTLVILVIRQCTDERLVLP